MSDKIGKYQVYYQLLFIISDNENCVWLLSDWGLSLAPKSITLDARTLDREDIILGKRTIAPNTQYDWTRDVLHDILVAVKITNWLLVCTDKYKDKAQDFTKCLIEVGQKMGIEINFPKIISLQNDRTDSYISRIRDEIHPAVDLIAFFPSSCVSLSFFNSIFMIFSWN